MQTGTCILNVLFLTTTGTYSGGENLALGKPTRQSSTAFGGNATLAVDGNLNLSYGGGSCTHTELGNYPWWKVDLLHSAYIWEVDIWNTDELGERLANVVITIENGQPLENGLISCDSNVCDIFPGPGENGKVYRFVCGRQLIGSVVRIEIPRTKAILSLCEVEVLGKYMEYIEDIE